MLETRPIGLADAQLLLGGVAGLNDVALRVQLETIALVAERYKVSSVARVAATLEQSVGATATP